jgi:hypothetical protein
MPAEYRFLSSTHRIFTKIDYILGHKANLIKDHKRIKLEVNNRNIFGNYLKTF